MSEILVVSTEAAQTREIVRVLSDAGYRARVAATFEDANRLLAARSPDLVIADVRLGAFNGLHVILNARAARPDVTAIVTTPVQDGGLEADARSLNVECLVKPQDPAEWLAPVERTLAAGGRTRVH